MLRLRAWLLSFILATAFAMGVVAIVASDPTTMLDEEEKESEQPDLDSDSIEADAALDGDELVTVDRRRPTDSAHRDGFLADAPTNEHRIDLHRPPAA